MFNISITEFGQKLQVQVFRSVIWANQAKQHSVTWVVMQTNRDQSRIASSDSPVVLVL